MRERVIAIVEWEEFGARFTDVHRGWLTLAVRREPTGVEHRLWSDAALQRLEVEDGRKGAGQLVVVAMTPDGHRGTGTCLRATASAPTRVTVLETDDGRHAGLRVEDAGGGTIEICFRVRTNPHLAEIVIDEDLTG